MFYVQIARLQAVAQTDVYRTLDLPYAKMLQNSVAVNLSNKLDTNSINLGRMYSGEASLEIADIPLLLVESTDVRSITQQQAAKARESLLERARDSGTVSRYPGLPTPARFFRRQRLPEKVCLETKMMGKPKNAKQKT